MSFYGKEAYGLYAQHKLCQDLSELGLINKVGRVFEG